MLSTWRISYSLETEFSLEALEIALEGWRQRSTLPIRAASSPHPSSWKGGRLRRSRSTTQDESAVATTSAQYGCGELQSMRMSTYNPIVMAGRLRSGWRASCGGLTLVDAIALEGAKLPMKSILIPNPDPLARE